MKPVEIFNELSQAGLSMQEALDFTSHVVQQKQASTGLVAGALGAIPGGLERVTGVLRNLQQMTYPVALAAAAVPPVVGYTMGDALARSLDSDGSDVEDIKQSEVIAELRTAANQLRRSRELGNRV